jgi:hypothetical protein
MVETVDATNISFFIDGVNVGTTALTTGNSLANVSTAEAYLARSGWGDPYWLGNIHKYSIYNKVLSSDEVLYLFQQGPEKDAVISATVSSLAFDSNYPAQVFNVSGTNLTSDITVTAPTGLLILDASGNSLTSIKANTSDVALTAIYDGSAVVDGNITLTSGSTVVTIPVKSADDVACFVPLYSEDISTDLNADPGLNSLATYGGWGTRTVETIITDPADVYWCIYRNRFT